MHRSGNGVNSRTMLKVRASKDPVVLDQLAAGAKSRVVTIVYIFSRFSPATFPGNNRASPSRCVTAHLRCFVSSYTQRDWDPLVPGWIRRRTSLGCDLRFAA